jgi:hypothetical protein
MTADEPMTSVKRDANDEANERKGDLDISTLGGAESCTATDRVCGQVKGQRQREIAHYRGAVEREPR